MRKVAFYIGYGLLPLLAAIAIVSIGSLYSDSSEYWTVAPWLIVVSIPACAVTLAVATITLIVHARTAGESSRKRNVAAGTFGVLNLMLIAAAGLWWLHSRQIAHDIDAEKVRALDFVRGHASVVERFGPGVDVSIVSYGTGATGPLPQRYEVSIDTKRPRGSDPGSQYVYAIVSVRESAGERQLALDCITPTYMGQRDPFKNPCEQ